MFRSPNDEWFSENRAIKAWLVLLTVCTVALLAYLRKGFSANLRPMHTSPPGLSRIRANSFPGKESTYGTLVVGCSGNLGNMMFEYASLYGLAKTNNLKPYFACDNGLLYESFKVTITRIERPPEGLTFVSGYLQSWKYFVNYFEEIRKEFTFEDRVRETCEQQFDKILKKLDVASSYVSVGIHARRGDFVRFGHAAANATFLHDAVALARRELSPLDRRIVFIVAGNDFQWNTNHVNASADVYVLKPISAAVDMCILSLCDHIIYSSGSYGWWSAFLSNGRAWYQKDICLPGTPLCLNHKFFVVLKDKITVIGSLGFSTIMPAIFADSPANKVSVQ
ncbi:unnamed protein product [Soboliphyme baturini]|uniref:L-Fucosyltransferase n=1 Tax=Soboliphyme baturini TaxID=241478 RepID=A0A183IZS3_9BILA|nr:unnamed protein product [Soboliphyme baturini]